MGELDNGFEIVGARRAEHFDALAREIAHFVAEFAVGRIVGESAQAHNGAGVGECVFIGAVGSRGEWAAHLDIVA